MAHLTRDGQKKKHTNKQTNTQNKPMTNTNKPADTHTHWFSRAFHLRRIKMCRISAMYIKVSTMFKPISVNFIRNPNRISYAVLPINNNLTNLLLSIVNYCNLWLWADCSTSTSLISIQQTHKSTKQPWTQQRQRSERKKRPKIYLYALGAEKKCLIWLISLR